MFVAGYTGYYLCRSNFSVCLPYIAAELEASGFSAGDATLRLGEIASLGVLVYALGKLLGGTLADRVGGRRTFLGGMLLSVVFTVGFALSGTPPLFTLAWIGNRAVQSVGWVGMVKVASRWFGHHAYARALAVVSLSFLFGDAAVRLGLGTLLGLGLGWRGVFAVAAAGLAGLALLTARLLRESPRELGLPEPEPHPANLFPERDTEPPTRLLRGLLASPGFLLACTLSLGLTLLRESFNTWTPTYFADGLALAPDAAARWSALFPAFGGAAVLLAGFVGDRVGRYGRAFVIAGGLFATAVLLLLLGAGRPGPALGVALVGFTGFAMLGPYSYLAGVVSLDFGGKAGSATACGVIDGVGYFGGILAGSGIARVVVLVGWDVAFQGLAAIALATGLLALGFARTEAPARELG